MSRFLKLVGVLGGTVLVLNLAVVALAQPRDAGWKMRSGDATANRYSRSYSEYYVSPAPAEGYRSFSYEPAMDVKNGDHVVVAAENAKVMLGNKVLATVNKGQEFPVLKVERGWLGAKLNVDGKEVSGWIWHDKVALAQNSP
jgi:hypothetical protein